ncbi:MAG TPA: hypothetical protein VHC18_17990 [Amycolatopsis sp.]|nr:hypothetical protein [Amycolatopsis sp.]
MTPTFPDAGDPGGNNLHAAADTGRGGHAVTWSATETGVLARAVSHAPSVHNTQPWLLETREGIADLYERCEVVLPRHDPTGRDRVLSCGAALANLDLALRVLGWHTTTILFPDIGRPGLIARIHADGRREATDSEVEMYSAIFRRRSYRAPFSLHHIPGRAVRLLAECGEAEGAQAYAIQGRAEAGVLADLLICAGRALRDDRAYQRELIAWSARFPGPLPDPATLPWVGLVHGGTQVPDRITLTERLLAERLLVVVTPGDSRRDHVLAGAVLERMWLTAVTHGLVGSVLTQPLHLPEMRAELAARLALPGCPQAILRVGYPVTATPAPAALAAFGEDSS